MLKELKILLGQHFFLILQETLIISMASLLFVITNDATLDTSNHTTV